jgi:hypothetical protein
MRLKNHASPLTIVLSILGLLSSNADATDYAANLSVAASGKHDDNVRMATTDKTPISGFAVSPTITLNANTEATHFLLDTTFDFARYNDSGFNTNDQRLNASANKHFERNVISLNADIIRDSTTTSELLDSGRIGTKAERTEEYALNPSWEMTLNEKNKLVMESAYSIRNYHDSAYIGYKNWNNSLDWSYALNERWRMDVVAQQSKYRSDRITVDVPAYDLTIPIFSTIAIIEKGNYGQQRYSSVSDSLGGQLGASYLISEKNSLQALVGQSKVKQSYSLDDPNNICGDTDFIRGFAALCLAAPETTTLTTAQLGWALSTEQHQLSLQVVKSQQPSSNGVTVDATRLTANWSYHVTELDQLSLDVSGTRNRSINKNNAAQSTSTLDRDYVAATAGYHRQFSESWYIDAAYQYRHQDYKYFDATAASNLITIGIRYTPVARHWSR